MKVLRYITPIAPLSPREGKIRDGINYLWDWESDNISDLRVKIVEDVVDDLVATGTPLHQITGRRIADRIDELSTKKI